MISEQSIPRVIHVLFYREEESWLAHCLDLDLIEQGATVQDAKRRIKRVVRNHLQEAIETQNGEDLSHPAPDEYWDALRNARDLGRETFQLYPKARRKALIEQYRLTKVPRTFAAARA